MEPTPSIAIGNRANSTQSVTAHRVHHRTYGGTFLQALQFVTDVIVLNALYHILLLARFGAFFWENSERLRGFHLSIYPELEIFMNMFWVAIAVSLQVYRPAQALDRTGNAAGGLGQIRTVVRAGLLLSGSLLVFVVAQGGYDYYSRIFLASFLTLVPIVLAGLRILEQSAATSVRNQTQPRKNVIVIGAGDSGKTFYNTVSAHPNYGYRVLGFLDKDGAASPLHPKILGTIQDLDRVATRETVDEIIIALPDSDEAMISNIVRECENRCIRVALIPSSEMALAALRSQTIERVGDLSLVRVREAPLDQWSNRWIKRGFDILFSTIVLALIFPIVFLVSAALIKLSSRGPIFFRQARTGEDGHTFICYKFRTMLANADDQIQAMRDDPRVTTIGRFLRSTSVDEFPQFWNVLKGEMSIVGPRPHPVHQTEQYRSTISQYMVRHFVKPGLTGWAQINGYRGETRNRAAIEGRIEHDLFYIEHWSFLLDLVIVAKTVFSIFKRDESAF